MARKQRKKDYRVPQGTHPAPSSPMTQESMRKRETKRRKTPRWWRTTRKQCLPGPAGQLYIQTQGRCSSTHKTGIKTSQAKSQHRQQMFTNPIASCRATGNCKLLGKTVFSERVSSPHSSGRSQVHDCMGSMDSS